MRMWMETIIGILTQRIFIIMALDFKDITNRWRRQTNLYPIFDLRVSLAERLDQLPTVALHNDHDWL